MKHLLLLTDGFPFGGSETFLYPEIEILIDYFTITIVTNDTVTPISDDYHWDLPIHRVSLDFSGFNYLFATVRALFSQQMRQEIRKIGKERKLFFKRIKDALFVYRKADAVSAYLQKHNLLEGKDLIYCYWHHHAPLGVHLAEKKLNLEIPIVCRTHGYELYNERIGGLRQPFKQYVDRTLTGVFFISQKGYDYHKASFGFAPTCFYEVARLGVSKAPIKMAESNKNLFRIVSVSNLIPLKRVHLIIEALHLIDSFDIEWIHFGAGVELVSLQRQAEEMLGGSNHVKYSFKGSVPNSHILAFYQTEAVDVFISTSSSEGCPVSIQEAFAYSIPVIAPTVGGITEMMRDEANGLTLSENPSPLEIKEKIERIHELKMRGEITAMKKEAYKTWDLMFRADKNFLSFANKLLNICEANS